MKGLGLASTQMGISVGKRHAWPLCVYTKPENKHKTNPNSKGKYKPKSIYIWIQSFLNITKMKHTCNFYKDFFSSHFTNPRCYSYQTTQKSSIQIYITT